MSIMSLDSPVNLLSLDGGGIRGVSALAILHEIMKRLQHRLGLKELPKPRDYFDLIGGTSTGGLIALMLVRLEMNTEEAVKQYNLLASKIFSKDNHKNSFQDGKFKASTLEREMKAIVAKSIEGATGDETLLDQSEQGRAGAFVCAVTAENTAEPRRFRTYEVARNSSANCKIWEAARATSAAPTFFKAIEIESYGGIKERFIDAGIRCNNPCSEVLNEAREIFGDDRRLGLLLSIGTGHQGPIGLEKPDAFQRTLPTKLIGFLRKIATDCESEARERALMFRNTKDIYIRFNVAHGAGGISLAEWEKMGEVLTHTTAYIGDVTISAQIDKIVEKLAGKDLDDQDVRLGQY